VRTCERKNNNGNHNRQISIMLHVTIIGSQVAWVTSCWLTGLVTNNFILNWIEMWDKKQRVALLDHRFSDKQFYIELTEWLFMVRFLICLCGVLCCCFNNPKILPSLQNIISLNLQLYTRYFLLYCLSLWQFNYYTSYDC
jgi:hypothetical protein